DALLQWGVPMGPLRLIDEIGVDITVDIANTLEKAYGKRDRAPKILHEMQSAKMLGRKSGGGFYKYEGKSQTANAEIEKWRGRLVAGVGDPGRPVASPSPDPGSATPATTRNYLALTRVNRQDARCPHRLKACATK